jgi:hypothetical protein
VVHVQLDLCGCTMSIVHIFTTSQAASRHGMSTGSLLAVLKEGLFGVHGEPQFYVNACG